MSKSQSTVVEEEDPPPPAEDELKTAAIQITAGATAGLVEMLLLQPLDVVKTRMQLQPSINFVPNTYVGVCDGFKKMIRHEGFSALYKGLTPCMFTEVPRRAVKFFLFEQLKCAVIESNEDIPVGSAYGVAGFCTGIVEAILFNPFEVIKVSLQADKTVGKDKMGVVDTTRDIVHRDGFGRRGLNRGMMVTMFRNGLFNMIYFGVYYNLREFLPQFENESVEVVKKMSIGFLAGTLACLVYLPFDVVKSRMQVRQPNPCYIKYSSAVRSINVVRREEGFSGLYKGLGPRVVRVGLGGAIMFVVYDYMHEIMRRLLE